jgi:hypothetical protein
MAWRVWQRKRRYFNNEILYISPIFLIESGSKAFFITLFLKVKVTLRLAVSQSVCLGVESLLVLVTRCLLLFHGYCRVLWGALSDGRSYLSFASLLVFHIVLHSFFLLWNNIWRFSSYLTGKPLRLRYRDQPVNAVWGNSRCLLWEPYGTHRYSSYLTGSTLLLHKVKRSP